MSVSCLQMSFFVAYMSKIYLRFKRKKENNMFMRHQDLRKSFGKGLGQENLVLQKGAKGLWTLA